MLAYDSQIDRICQYFFIGSIFLLPLTVLGNNIFMWVTAIIWMCSGDYLNKLRNIKANKLALVSVGFFCVHLLGLIWTEDIIWGLIMTKKMLPFFFILPIFLTISKKENLPKKMIYNFCLKVRK